MYSIYLNDKKIYDDTYDDSSYALTGAVLSLEAGAAGSLTIQVPQQNKAYDQFRTLADYVDVYRGNELVFSGRVYSVAKDYAGLETVVFEGLLAVFNDSVLRPGIFNDTLINVINQIIDSHNSQVGNDKKINIGSISISESQDSIYRNYENYESTKTRLDDFVESYGGYMRIRKQADGLYLDWIADYGSEASQTIDFGHNLLNLDQAADASEIVSVLIPLGKNIEIKDESGNTETKTVTIESVNNNLDYIENAEAVAKYGRIVQVMTWDDVETPAALLTKATAYLNDVSRGRVNITASAVDMASAGSSIEAWRLGDMVTVNAAYFGIQGEKMMIRALNLDLQNPASNTLSLNSVRVGFIGTTASSNNNIRLTIENNFSELNNEINIIDDRVTSASSGIISTGADIELFAKVINGTATSDEIESWENAALKITAQGIRAEIENSNNQSIWLNVDADAGVTIGRKDSPVISVQDNESYKFKDTKTNTELLRIDTQGMTASTANVTGQITMLNGSVKQWAIRKGKYVQGVGVNLNDVWIG